MYVEILISNEDNEFDTELCYIKKINYFQYLKSKLTTTFNKFELKMKEYNCEYSLACMFEPHFGVKLPDELEDLIVDKYEVYFKNICKLKYNKFLIKIKQGDDLNKLKKSHWL